MLLDFKEWVKKVYGLTQLELMTKPISYQQMVHQHYANYVEVWEEEK
ncbi:hypothetical protein JDW15_04255 [Aerococcaceae bacterium zg-ZJ1578]|nr:hypothetical protein [Aerococcaceae bacterium zg-1578]